MLTEHTDATFIFRERVLKPKLINIGSVDFLETRKSCHLLSIISQCGYAALAIKNGFTIIPTRSIHEEFNDMDKDGEDVTKAVSSLKGAITIALSHSPTFLAFDKHFLAVLFNDNLHLYHLDSLLKEKTEPFQKILNVQHFAWCPSQTESLFGIISGSKYCFYTLKSIFEKQEEIPNVTSCAFYREQPRIVEDQIKDISGKPIYPSISGVSAVYPLNEKNAIAVFKDLDLSPIVITSDSLHEKCSIGFSNDDTDVKDLIVVGLPKWNLYAIACCLDNTIKFIGNIDGKWKEIRMEEDANNLSMSSDVVGMSLDMTNNKVISTKDSIDTIPASPCLWILTSDGLLKVFSVIHTTGEKISMVKPVPVPELVQEVKQDTFTKQVGKVDQLEKGTTPNLSGGTPKYLQKQESRVGKMAISLDPVTTPQVLEPKVQKVVKQEIPPVSTGNDYLTKEFEAFRSKHALLRDRQKSLGEAFEICRQESSLNSISQNIIELQKKITKHTPTQGSRTTVLTKTQQMVQELEQFVQVKDDHREVPLDAELSTVLDAIEQKMSKLQKSFQRLESISTPISPIEVKKLEEMIYLQADKSRKQLNYLNMLEKKFNKYSSKNQAHDGDVSVIAPQATERVQLLKDKLKQRQTRVIKLNFNPVEEVNEIEVLPDSFIPAKKMERKREEFVLVKPVVQPVQSKPVTPTVTPKIHVQEPAKDFFKDPIQESIKKVTIQQPKKEPTKEMFLPPVIQPVKEVVKSQPKVITKIPGLQDFTPVKEPVKEFTISSNEPVLIDLKTVSIHDIGQMVEKESFSLDMEAKGEKGKRPTEPVIFVLTKPGTPSEKVLGKAEQIGDGMFIMTLGNLPVAGTYNLNIAVKRDGKNIHLGKSPYKVEVKKKEKIEAKTPSSDSKNHTTTFDLRTPTPSPDHLKKSVFTDPVLPEKKDVKKPDFKPVEIKKEEKKEEKKDMFSEFKTPDFKSPLAKSSPEMTTMDKIDLYAPTPTTSKTSLDVFGSQNDVKNPFEMTGGGDGGGFIGFGGSGFGGSGFGGDKTEGNTFGSVSGGDKNDGNAFSKITNWNTGNQESKGFGGNVPTLDNINESNAFGTSSFGATGAGGFGGNSWGQQETKTTNTNTESSWGKYGQEGGGFSGFQSTQSTTGGFGGAFGGTGDNQTSGFGGFGGNNEGSTDSGPFGGSPFSGNAFSNIRQ
jgi:hypothetical protein